jgi:hypothetical protein
MQGRGSVTAAHFFFCRDARTTVTVRKRTKLLKVFKSKAAVTSEAPVTKGHTGASGFRLRGETNGGEGSPPRRHSNALMCLFSNAHGLLRCHQHSRARHDLRLWKQPCHSLGNLRRARAGPSACMRGCGASRSAWTWSRQSNCRAMFSHWKTLPRERIKTRSPAARFLAGTSR